MKLNVFVWLAFLLVVLSACSKKSKTSLEVSENSPIQTIYDTESMYTDNGELSMKLYSPELQDYGNEPKTQIFPKGVKAEFYETSDKLNVILRSDSAINFPDQKMMKFFKNVVVYDFRNGDTLFTQALYWNQEKRIIFSDQKVRKVSRYMTLEGDGFDSDEQMNDVVLRNPRGVLY